MNSRDEFQLLLQLERMPHRGGHPTGLPCIIPVHRGSGWLEIHVWNFNFCSCCSWHWHGKTMQSSMACSLSFKYKACTGNMVMESRRSSYQFIWDVRSYQHLVANLRLIHAVGEVQKAHTLFLKRSMNVIVFERHAYHVVLVARLASLAHALWARQAGGQVSCGKASRQIR